MMEALNRILGDLWALVPNDVASAIVMLEPRHEVFVFAIGLLALLGVRSAIRIIFAKGARRKYEAEIRQLELRIEAAKLENEVRGHESMVRNAADFLDQLRATLAEGRAVDDLDLPLDWLDDLKPTLAEAYTLMARHGLFVAESPDEFERARKLAWGALAADVEPEMVEDILEAVQEAEVHNVYDALTESELLAWKIGRLSTETGFDVVAAGVIEKNRHRIGGTMLVSGWEPDEIRSAALARLDWADADIPEMALARHGWDVSQAAFGPDEVRVCESDDQAAENWVIVPMKKTQDPFRANDSKRSRARDQNDRARALLIERVRPNSRGGGIRALRIRANAVHEAARVGKASVAEAEFRTIWTEMEAAGQKAKAQLDAMTARHNMAYEIARQGCNAQAAVHYRAILEQISILPDRDAGWALEMATRHDLAETIGRDGRHGDAEEEFRAVWEAREANPAFGPQHPATLWSRLHMIRMREALNRRTA